MIKEALIQIAPEWSGITARLVNFGAPRRIAAQFMSVINSNILLEVTRQPSLTSVVGWMFGWFVGLS